MEAESVFHRIDRAPFTICYTLNWAHRWNPDEIGGGSDYRSKSCTSVRPYADGRVEVVSRARSKPRA